MTAVDYGPSTDAWGMNLADPAIVSHQGKVVLIARVPGTGTNVLYYRVLDTSPLSVSDDADWYGWYRLDLPSGSSQAAPVQLEPAGVPEVRLAGMELVTVPLATSDFVPDDVGIRVLSDEDFICVIRQGSKSGATTGSLMINRLRLIEVPAGDAEGRTDQRTIDYRLEPAWEVRYKRSQIKDVPASNLDTVSSMNVDKRPFFEPTVNVAFADGVAAGRFDVVLVPTSTPGTVRWYFFVSNDTDLKVFSATQHEQALQFGQGQLVMSVSPKDSSNNNALPVMGGPGAAFFPEREEVGVDGTHVQRAAHLMVAMPVGSTATPVGTMVIDFEVGADGSIAAIDGSHGAPIIDTAPTGPYRPPASAIRDVDGLVVSTAILGQVKTTANPLVRSGADGLVHLYYGALTSSPEAPFEVAHYETAVTRASIDIPWQARSENSAAQLVARRSGPTLDGMSATIVPSTTWPGYGDVTVNYGSASDITTQVFASVPLDLDPFMTILNGEAIADPFDTNALSGNGVYYDYTCLRPMVPVTVGGHTRPLLLVSCRTDVPLRSVNLTDNGSGGLTMQVDFGKTSTVFSQTWSNLPTDLTTLTSVLRNQAAPATYNYIHNDPAVFQLDYLGAGGILMIGANGVPAGLVMTVEDDTAHPGKAKVTFSTGSTTISDVPRDAPGFVAKLQANASVTVWFSVISPELPVPGDPVPQVANQVVSQPLQPTGRLTLFALIPPGNPLSGTVAPFNSTETARIQGQTPGRTPPHGWGLTGAFVVNATPPLVPPAVVQIPRKPLVPSTPALTGAWIEKPIVNAFTAGGVSAMEVPLTDPTTAARIVPHQDWTFESWIKPTSAVLSTVLEVDGTAAAAPPESIKPNALLATIGQKTLSFSAYTKSPGTADSAHFLAPGAAPPPYSFAPTDRFTWEVWVKPSQADPTGGHGLGGIIQVADVQGNPTKHRLVVGLNAKRNLTVVVLEADQMTLRTLTSSAVVPLDWTHVAVTFHRNQAGSGPWTVTLYVDGRPTDAPAADVSIDDSTNLGQPVLVIGASDLNNASMFGSMASLRYWGITRTSAEIRAAMYTNLTAHQPGLWGDWVMSGLTGNVGVDCSTAPFPSSCILPTKVPLGGRFPWDADVEPMTKQTITFPRASYFASVVGQAGGLQVREGEAFLRTDRWNHVALALTAGGGVHLNPAGATAADYVDLGDNAGLNVETGIGIDSWLSLADPTFNGEQNTIISKWGVEVEDQSYEFSVTAAGGLMLRLMLEDGVNDTLTLFEAWTGQVFTSTVTTRHVAVGVIITAPKASGAAAVIDVEFAVAGVAIDPTTVNVKYGTDPAQTGGSVTLPDDIGALIHATNTPGRIGSTKPTTVPSEPVPQDLQALYRGRIGTTRLWSQLPALNLVFPEAQRVRSQRHTVKNLISGWDFSAQRRLSVKDETGENNASLSRDTLWTTFLSTSRQTMFVNGSAVGVMDEFAYTPPTGLSEPQFVVAATKTGARTLAQPFNGNFTGVRIWSSARTEEEISDNRFRPLLGSEPDLMGYWPFADGLNDATGGGNDGTVLGTATAPSSSTAPIGLEAPVVRNVYRGAVNDFQQALSGSAAVAEYADMQPRPDGTYAAVLKRAYAFVDTGLEIVTGFKLGDLDLIHIGQVQTNPTLIGVIEGAPPVPSENLSRPFYLNPAGAPYMKYLDNSTVSLVQQTTGQISFDASRATGFDFSTDVKAGFFFRGKAETGPGFFNVESFYAEAVVGAHGNYQLARSATTTDHLSSQWTDTSTTFMGLSGDWEPHQASQNDYLDPNIGRRFVPDNYAFALVESLTADLYTMRLAITKTMVGSTILPNFDIPPDRNILLFPMRNDYVRQGSLDGKVGLANDPAYMAAGGENPDQAPGSYFKPVQAYGLAAKLERDSAVLATYKAQFDPEERGKSEESDISEAQAAQFADASGDAVRRGIANRYVWTADGGLYREEQSFLSSITTSHAGEYRFTHLTGLNVDVKVPGFAGALDMLFGGHTDITVSSSEEHTRAFQLNVTADSEAYLRTWEQPTTPGTEGEYLPGAAPGKVRAYRFMSFYLPPSSQNSTDFMNIVDREWLIFSTSPAAAALRQINTTNPTWRVLHRVTYIDRVPPKISAPDGKAEPANPEPINVGANLAVIALVKTALGNKAPTVANVGTAVREVVNPTESGGTYPPSQLGTVVPWYPEFLAAARDPQANPGAAQALEAMTLGMVEYMYEGFSTVMPGFEV